MEHEKASDSLEFRQVQAIRQVTDQELFDDCHAHGTESPTSMPNLQVSKEISLSLTCSRYCQLYNLQKGQQTTSIKSSRNHGAIHHSLPTNFSLQWSILTMRPKFFNW
jgi:hypothetical protein